MTSSRALIVPPETAPATRGPNRAPDVSIRAGTVDSRCSSPSKKQRQFRADLSIPRGVQVWLGAFVGAHKRRGHFTNQYITINNGRFKGYEIYVFTYVLGFVAIQLTASRWTSLTKSPPNYVPKLTQMGEWVVGTEEIWPGERRPFIVWPPPKIIGDQTLNTFIDRWRTLTERSIRLN